MEAAMGTYESEEARAGLEALRAQVIRAGAEALRAQAESARESALRQGKTEGTRDPKGQKLAGDEYCSMHWAIAAGCYHLSAEYQKAGDADTALFYQQHAAAFTLRALECEAGGS